MVPTRQDEHSNEPTAGIVFDPSIPLHHQIYLQLRHEIADGLWIGRDDFPGEREVAEVFGASVITARSALDRLNGEGWIRRHRGRRPQVLHAPTLAHSTNAMLMPVAGFRPSSYDVVFADVRVAPAEACAAFELDAGSELWQCSRVRSLDGRPHSVTHNAQRPEVGALHDPDDLRAYPMVHLLGQRGHTIARMRRHMSAGQAPAHATSALGLSIAASVLTITFTLHDQTDDIVQWVRLYMHPDVPTPGEMMDLATGTWTTTEWR